MDICVDMYICMYLLFIEKKLQMISGTDTKTRTLLPNDCPDHLDTGKLCPALPEEKPELVSGLLGQCSQWKPGKRCVSVQHSMGI